MKFYKYQGAGNDFVVIDNREMNFPVSAKLINHLCNRRFGIGADGLMLLQNESGFDFRMVYFNADGNESTMCGNGGRCIAHFANYLGIIEDSATFIAIDGPHEAEIEGIQVNLKMINVDKVEEIGGDFWLDTGSPHYVQFVDDLKNLDVFTEGKSIRNSERFIASGTNVNFVEPKSRGIISIRTYERGVEAETLACGTGVTAAAIVYGTQHGLSNIKVKAQGGDLEVRFEKNENSFQDVWLKGPAEMVFEGSVEI